jgi:quercetin dioxygenase-like cupin family protein
MTARYLVPALSLATSVLIASPAVAQGTSHPIGRNVPEMTFAPVPGLPACATGAVQTGNPEAGPSIVLSKIAAGCVIPWHWHTPNEHLMLVSGAATIETRHGKPVTLAAGGFALMPSKHVHQFRCQETCLLYVYSDAAFDMHYVNAQNTEITPDAAFAAAGATASARPK